MFGRGMRQGYPYGYPQESLIDEVLEVEAIEDLMDGDFDGFVEDEMLASIF